MAKPVSRTAPAKKPAPAPKQEVDPAVEETTQGEVIEGEGAAILVSDELLDACRAAVKDFADQGPKEEDSAYFQRILTTLGEVDEATFDTLSEGAQAWFNTSVELLNASEPVAAPEGFVSKKVARSAPQKTGAKTTAPGNEKPAPVVRGPSKTMGIRESVCAKPAITLDELLKAHPEANKSTISTIRSDVMATIAAAKKTGHWKD